LKAQSGEHVGDIENKARKLKQRQSNYCEREIEIDSQEENARRSELKVSEFENRLTKLQLKLSGT
jgi:hypothetical protein